MSREMKIKSQVLDMLEQMLMSNEGKRFAPKEVEVEVVTAEPAEDLEDVLAAASEHRPTEDDLDDDSDGHAEPDGDEYTGAQMEGSCDDEEEMEEEAMKKPRGLRDFMDR
jgi:ATPase subunit of ABC transporter with duplicated ATPase domains